MPLSEKDLEDWVEANIDELFNMDRGWIHKVFRQFRLPTGRRIDLLAIRACTGGVIAYVIELKAKRADESAVLQLLAYMGTLRICLPGLYAATADDDWDVLLRGVLVAPDITDGARLCLEASDELQYIGLAVSIAPSREYVTPSEVRQGDPEAFGATLAAEFAPLVQSSREEEARYTVPGTGESSD